MDIYSLKISYVVSQFVILPQYYCDYFRFINKGVNVHFLLVVM